MCIFAQFVKIRLMRPLFLTNTLSRNKELFKPIHEGRVGMCTETPIWAMPVQG